MKRVLHQTTKRNVVENEGQKKRPETEKKGPRKKREKTKKVGSGGEALFRPSEGPKNMNHPKTQGLPFIGENVFF